MKRKMKTILLSLVFLLTCTTAIALVPERAVGAEHQNGNIYYVSVTGDDRNDGLSLTTPFRTIQQAADIAEAGDTVYVRGGIYNEEISIEISGTETGPIVFKNYNGETPVIDGTGLDTETGVWIPDCDYVVFSGFTVCNFTSFDNEAVIGIFVEGSGMGIEIRNCKVHDIKTTYDGDELDRNAHGIAVYGTNSDPDEPIASVVIDGNEVWNCRLGQSESVVLNGNVTDFAVTNNKVHDNDNIGIDFAGFEGTANDEAAGDKTAAQDRARDGICSGNRIWNITCADNPTYIGDGLCADGLYVDGGCNIVLEKNVINNCDIGIEAASEHYGCATERITIRNNLIKNCRGVAGISIGGSDPAENGTAKNIVIVNNTLYYNEPSIGIQNANSRTNVIRNNICFNNKGTFLEGRVGNNLLSNNITADPLFVNAASGNFALKAGSPAIDAGTYADYGSSDLAGSARVNGAKVDCGAYEYRIGL